MERDAAGDQAFLYSSTIGTAPSLIEPSPLTAYGINYEGQVVGSMGAASGSSETRFL